MRAIACMTSKHSIGHFHWIVLKHSSRHNTERYVDGVEVAIDCKTTGRRLVHWASSLLIISACGLQDAMGKHRLSKSKYSIAGKSGCQICTMTNTQQNRTTICACIGIDRVGKTDYCDNRLMSEIIKASGYHVLVSNPYSNARCLTPQALR